jgi:hypothetical protein
MEIVSNAMQEFKFIVWVISLNQVLELVAHVIVLLLGFNAITTGKMSHVCLSQ